MEVASKLECTLVLLPIIGGLWCLIYRDIKKLDKNDIILAAILFAIVWIGLHIAAYKLGYYNR